MKILLFDIDGTLMLSGGAGRRAIDRAFFELYGISDAFGEVVPDGNTDPKIFSHLVGGRLDVLDRWVSTLWEQTGSNFSHDLAIAAVAMTRGLTVVPALFDRDRVTATSINLGDSAPVVREFGGDYRNLQFDFGEVMVDDYNIRALCGGDGIERQCAAIDADDQVMRLRQSFHRGRVGAVAFVNPVGHVECGAAPLLSKPVEEQSR